MQMFRCASVFTMNPINNGTNMSELKPEIKSRHLPVSYRVEIYEDSFVNDPTVSFETLTPLPAFHVGDYVSPRTWPMTPNANLEKGQTFRVKAIDHLIWRVDGSHVGYSTSVCVEVAEKPEDVF